MLCKSRHKLKSFNTFDNTLTLFSLDMNSENNVSFFHMLSMHTIWLKSCCVMRHDRFDSRLCSFRVIL